MLKMLIRAFYLSILVTLLTVAGIGIYSYLNGILEPSYDQKTMTLNYERIGDGPQKIVLLHGLTGSLKYWKKGLENASQAYSILLIDLLGFGDSPKPNSKYDINEHLAAIDKVLKIEGFDSGDTFVVGHSLGAILSLGLVGKHSEWFDGVVAIGLPIYADKEELKEKFAKISLWDGLSVDSSYQFVCYFHPLYMTEWFRPANLPKDVFEDARKHTWVSYYRTLDQVLVNTDVQQLALNIQDNKILLIHGENDTAAPIENVAASLPFFKNARFERLEGEDHQVYLADPATIWALIDDFTAVENHKESDLVGNSL